MTLADFDTENVIQFATLLLLALALAPIEKPPSPLRRPVNARGTGALQVPRYVIHRK